MWHHESSELLFFSPCPSQFLKVVALTVSLDVVLNSAAVFVQPWGSLPAFLCFSFAAEGLGYPSLFTEVFGRANVSSILIVNEQT